MIVGNDKAPVLSVGRLYCDLIFTDLPRMPSLGTEVFGDQVAVHAGGGAFITAAHLGELGHPSALAAMLPAAPYADLIRRDLEEAALDLSLCAPLASSDGPQITVALAHASDRAFLTHRAGPAHPALSGESLGKLGIRHLHIGEAATLIDTPELIDMARAQNATISVDCGWEDDFDATALKRCIASVDVFLPNEAEVGALKDLGLSEALAPITLIKRGARGATLISEGTTLTAPALPATALDTTGAGDAFNAGFLSAWLSGAPLQTCLEAANARGALAVQSPGGFRPTAGKP